MKDPYEILGVKPGASDDDIKSAYHRLVKKYHPDKYQNNPLADLAEEKLREVNEAYDMLSKKSNANTNSYGGGYSDPSSYTYSGGSAGTEYMAIRAALDRGELARAEQMLINCKSRDAQWFFLSGVLSYRKGYIDDGISNVSRAMEMQPGNAEFRQVYQRMINQSASYRSYGDSRGYNDSSECGSCLSCLCLTSICSPCC